MTLFRTRRQDFFEKKFVKIGRTCIRLLDLIEILFFSLLFKQLISHYPAILQMLCST